MKEFEFSWDDLLRPPKNIETVKIFYTENGDIVGISSKITEQFANFDYIDISKDEGQEFLNGYKDPGQYMVTVHNLKKELVKKTNYRTPGVANGMIELNSEKSCLEDDADVKIVVFKNKITVSTIESDEKFNLYIVKKYDPSILIDSFQIYLDGEDRNIKVDLDKFTLIVDNQNLFFFYEVKK